MIVEVKTPQEQEVLDEFRKIVEELNQDDITLIRFLKARDFDITKAEKMLREALLWRKEHKIDSILEWDAPAYLKTDLSYSVTGFDYDGGPVVWIPFGLWNHRPWIEQGYGDELLRYGFRLIEHVFQVLKSTPDGKYQCVAIFDLGNITYYQACHIQSLKVLYNGFKALEQNYPEVLKEVVVVNAPWLFSIPFNFIKGTVSQHTLSKLKVFDSNKKNWLNHLLERIPQKSLPPQFFEDENGN